MKLLLDACVSRNASEHLQAGGHDVVWAGLWDVDPGDAEILSQAFAEGRVLITLDRDFGELAVREGAAHCGIVRLVNLSVYAQGLACETVLSRFGPELTEAAIVTVEPGRVRIRPGGRTDQ